MPSIGPGACEIRIHTANEYRVIYVAKFPMKVYVLHAFEKKTQKTNPKALDLARRAINKCCRDARIYPMTRKESTLIKITKSTGNVFQDLGFPPAQAANLALRSELMDSLLSIVTRRRLDKAQAAKLFGVKTSRVDDLKKGHIERLTLDNLCEMLIRAGVAVKITLSPKKTRAA